MSILPDEVPIVLVNHPVTAEGNDVRFMARNWVLVTPRMTQGRGAMHIKVRPQRAQGEHFVNRAFVVDHLGALIPLTTCPVSNGLN